MRANKVNLKPRKTKTLENFRGVDYSLPPNKVSVNRATEMSNFLCEYGINHKRHGWNELVNLGDKINLIFKDGTDIIVQAGTRFYKINNGVCSDITPDGNVLNRTSYVLYHKNKAYVIGCGRFLEYSNGELKDVNPYIPTTSTNITASFWNGGSGDIFDYTSSLLDKPNLLTNKRINKGIGTSLNRDSENPEPFFAVVLDSAWKYGSDVNVEIGTTYNNEYCVIKARNSDENHKNSLIAYHYPDGMFPGQIQIGVITNAQKKDVQYGVLTFLAGFPSPVAEDPNITIHYEADVENLSSRITDCALATMFGVENEDRLFLSGNSNFKNIIFYSEQDDFSYFPDTNTKACGSTAISSFAKTNDGSLAIFKKKGNEPSIYFCKGYNKDIYDANGNFIDIRSYFATTATGFVEEAINNTYANFLGDQIFVTKNGVMALTTPTQNTTEKDLRERSRNINNRLKTLNSAVGTVYDGKYYLSLGDGQCFVADSRYKIYRNDDKDNSFNYEWFRLTNIPACIWAVIDDMLFFGTSDGSVCIFDDEYTDRKYIECVVSYNHDTNALDVNENLYNQIEDGTEVLLNQTAQINTVALSINTVRIPNINTVYEDFRLDENSVLKNISIDDSSAQVYTEGVLQTFIPGAEVLLICKIHKAYVKKCGDNTIQLTDILGNIIQFCGWIQNSTAFKLKSNVVAEYITPAFDMGTVLQSKTLLKMSIVAESITHSRLSVGFETKNAISELTKVKGINKFDFNDLDFSDFSFDTGFISSHTITTYQKFNYIMFRFRSDNDRDCAINQLTLLYNINDTNRGVK